MLNIRNFRYILQCKVNIFDSSPFKLRDRKPQSSHIKWGVKQWGLYRANRFWFFAREIPCAFFQNQTKKNCASAISSGVRVGIDALTPSQNYQMKSSSSPPSCSASITHRNHFLRLYQCDTSEHNRCLFLSARNNCKRILFADRMRHCTDSNKFHPDVLL